MTKTRNISDLLDANGDVKSAALDNVPPSNDASALTTGTLPDARLSSAIVNQSAFKNIIINGDMSIAQRGTSFAGQTVSNYIVDRFIQNINNAIGTWTNGQETDAPANTGFKKSLFMNCTTADAAPTATDFVRVEQRFEGQNLQYLKKGTANAESLTLSFWVKSPKTGTHIAELEDRDNSRYVSQSYTINTANTWEYKTVTFPGDTTGTLNNDNGESLRLNFYLGAGATWSSGTLGTTWHTTAANRAVGQVNVADAIHSAGNYWQITGVQLEVGSAASDFEFLPVDVNLQRCQRYYQVLAPGGVRYIPVVQYQANFRSLAYTFPTEMRAVPSMSVDTFANFSSFNGTDMTENTVHAYVDASYSLGTSYVVRGVRFNAEL